MSSVKIEGNASGTGIFTIASPNSNTNRTLTLPDATGTILTSASTANFPAGSIRQVVNYQTGALATGTTTLPIDNTIPQNTEGIEFMTLAITPTSASSKLLITVFVMLSNSVNNSLTAALFQDSTANALAVGWDYRLATIQSIISFNYYMTAGTTSSTTFKVRAGGNNAGTTTFNGYSGAGFYGGTLTSSITIMEIAA